MSQAAEAQVVVERVGRHQLIAHIQSTICVLSERDFFTHMPEHIVLKGLRRGKALKRGIASKLRQLRKREQELNEASAPWGGLVAYEKRKNSEAVHS